MTQTKAQMLETQNQLLQDKVDLLEQLVKAKQGKQATQKGRVSKVPTLDESKIADLGLPKKAQKVAIAYANKRKAKAQSIDYEAVCVVGKGDDVELARVDWDTKTQGEPNTRTMTRKSVVMRHTYKNHGLIFAEFTRAY